MKLTKLFIIFFILTLSFIACRKTKLQVTEPVFPKEYEGYSYVGNYGSIVGIYGKGNEYKLVIKGLGDATLKSNQKEAIDKIYKIVGNDGVGNVLSSLKDLDTDNLDKKDTKDTIDTIIKNSNISEDKKKEIEKIIFGENNKDNIFKDFTFNIKK